jgi:hypothetical protein
MLLKTNNTEINRNATQTGHVALTDSAELPLAVVTINLSEVQGSFITGILREVITDNLSLSVLIEQTDVSIANLTEVLTALLTFVDRNSENNLLHVSRDKAQINGNLLIVTVAFTGLVVTLMDNRANSVLRLVVENEVRIGANLTVSAEQKSRGVKVKRSTVSGTNIPTQTNAGADKRRVFLGQ